MQDWEKKSCEAACYGGIRTPLAVGDRVVIVAKHPFKGREGVLFLVQGAQVSLQFENGDRFNCLDYEVAPALPAVFRDPDEEARARAIPGSKREAAEQHAAAGIGPTTGKELAGLLGVPGYHDRKFDQGKPRIDLIPGEALEGIGDVLAYGAAKYAEDSWQHVPDAVKRYRAALLRHMVAIQKGETHDVESGKLHIDHVATNAAFLQYFARKT